jgi:hypothetical protein
VGDTLANGLDIRANGAIGISLRENGRYIAHLVRALLVSAPVTERENDRGCDKSPWLRQKAEAERRAAATRPMANHKG